MIDDHSTDGTAAVAAEAGARVVAVDDVLPELGPGEGKGEALWKSVAAAEGDLIVWCDADILDFGPRFVVGLVGPLLARADIGFVKGFYDRPVEGSAHGGGRVTELVARPTIATMFPHLASIVQPLAGEYAGPAEPARAAAVRAGLRRRPRACSSTSPTSRAPRSSPRSTSAPAATATARSTSSGRRRSPSCRPRCAARAPDAAARPPSSAPTWSRSRWRPGSAPPLVDVPGYRRRTA